MKLKKIINKKVNYIKNNLQFKLIIFYNKYKQTNVLNNIYFKITLIMFYKQTLIILYLNYIVTLIFTQYVTKMQLLFKKNQNNNKYI